MLLTKIIVINVFFITVYSQVTKVVKQNPLLSRRKRYLTFPMNSNFVIGMAYVKALIMVQPRGWNALGECGFPFPLPSDTRLFKNLRRNDHIQKREILTGLEAAFNRGGFNGTACVQRMMCEAQHYIGLKSKSMVKDILSAVFLSVEDDLLAKFGNSCDGVTLAECEVPFLSYILESIFNT